MLMLDACDGVYVDGIGQLTIHLAHYRMATGCSEAMNAVRAPFLFEILESAPKCTNHAQLFFGFGQSSVGRLQVVASKELEWVATKFEFGDDGDEDDVQIVVVVGGQKTRHQNCMAVVDCCRRWMESIRGQWLVRFWLIVIVIGVQQLDLGA